MRLKPTARVGTGLLRILIFAVMLALAVSIAFGWISAGSGGTALGVALVGVLALILTRADFRGILARVQKVDAWGLAVDLKAVTEADEAVRGVKGDEASEEATEGAGDEPDEHPVDIIDLRLRLENKLVYIGQHVLPEGYSEFTSIGSLRARRFLNQAQARTAARVLSFSNLDIKALPDAERDAFVNDAKILVGNIRAIVFWSVVRKTLRAGGWDFEVIRRPGRLPDYLATKDGQRVRVAPAFSTETDSDVLKRAIARVQRSNTSDPEVDRRVVVVPDHSPHETDVGAEPPIAKVRDMIPLLG